ncbi:hypothetical protein [Diaphorobacter sp.]|uniref:hypothetical protein n=1 Tax=Diaphorobacter sp. TaxID=1934310 RepID=UPI0028AAB6E1|nr:hypothetical protein [Diaphorobacter sp.]
MAETVVSQPRRRAAVPIQIVIDTSTGEQMPTDKLVDVTPEALRMSSPFNSTYWLAAA